jgi:hypothetical protein
MMSNIAANTRIKLGASVPKKDAVVDTPGTAAGADEVAIWAAVSVPENKTQTVVGGFHMLFAYCKSNMPAIAAAVTTPTVVHMPWNGNISDIEIDGTPTAEEIRIEIGQTIGSGQKSHFFKRTFDRLIERWLEESK